jgi:exopolyphosphatase/guanosine-5'-triphosphate,3'-diphosphate pyrophosphatase
MIRAAIDIGSNSTLFLVAENRGDGQWRLLEEDLITNGLAWDLTPTGELTDHVQERNLDILVSLIQRAYRHGTATIRAAGTAALRKAKNSEEFCRKVQRETALGIRVVSGQEEARLTYLGAMLDFPEFQGVCRVIDVGGGSSELVMGRGKELLDAVSIPLGAVTLTQSSIPSQPLTAEQSDQLLQFIVSELDSVPDDIINAPCPVIAVGGTASTLAALTLEIDISDLWQRKPVPVSYSDIESYWKRFAHMSVEGITEIPHMPPDRASIITAGTGILLGILSKLQAEKLLLSNKGLRWGLLIDDNIT